MALGTLAHTVGKWPLKELTAKLEGRGVDFVQLALSKAIADIDTGTGRLSSGLANHVAEAFNRKGIRIGVLGCYIDPIHPDPEERRRQIVRFKEHIRFARDFGAPMVATETGMRNTYAEVLPDRYEHHGWETLRQTVEELAEEAERWGVTVGLEPVSSHTLSSAEKMSRILEEVPSSVLGVVFDPCNLLTVPDMERQEAFLDECFGAFGDRMVLVHLKDAFVRDGELVTSASGTGDFRSRAFLERLQGVKPHIDISLEMLSDDNLDDTFALVRSWF